MGNTVKILITGDFYGGNRIKELILKQDYNQIFNDFLPVVRNADIAITNLEAPLLTCGMPIDKTGPAIKSVPETIAAIKYAGFKLLTLANNHIMDYGAEGLHNTIKLSKENEIAVVGAGDNLEKASKTLFKEVKGITIAFINIAENEWSTTNDDTPGAHPLNPVANYYKIKEANEIADFIIVIVHGGHEMYNLPSPRMKETYRFFIDAGADAVVGHHTHCYSGYEIYQNKPLFYGLGNFIFDRSDLKEECWHFGYGVNFLIFDNLDVSFEILPFEQCNSTVGVNLLDQDQKDQFFEKISKLNIHIQNDDFLMKSFNDFIKNINSKPYKAFLEPHSSRFLFYLQNKGILPSLLSKRKKKLYLNLIRCEAHRDVVINLMNNDCNT